MSQSPSLPKDVGLCDQCSARNSKHAKTCNSCSATLPWAQAKAAKGTPSFGRGAGAPSAANQPPATARPAAMGGPPAQAGGKIPDIGAALGSVDWGATILAGFLALLVFFVSLSCPLIGIGLYRYFANEDNWMRYAAGAALGLVLLGIALRFIMMGVVGAEAVNN